MERKRILSIAHFEGRDNALHDDTYYQMIKKASQEFRDEIHDIYFGKFFRYQHDGRERRYANPMGVEATDAQVDSLFRIQDEFGIPISLTVNSIETPHELFFDDKVIKKFIEFLASFYERGLRSCTIASPHIMRSKTLHHLFPEMRWKNTVNNRITNAQQVLDFIFCGYDTILLDRTVCRDIGELRKIRRAVDYYNKKYKPAKKVLTSLLTTEGCLYNCPFKKEHDSIGEHISGQYFQTISKMTCDNWRFTDPYHQLPRNGVDLVISDKEAFKEIVELTDILKFSGRFNSFPFKPGEIGNGQARWMYLSKQVSRLTINPVLKSDLAYSDNLTDPIGDNILPVHLWTLSCGDVNEDGNYYRDKLAELHAAPNFWRTVKGKRLAKILRSCRSQCWECHECEKTFEISSFDSALQLAKAHR